MTPKSKNGVRTVRLHAPEVRRIEEGSMVYRQIAASISDVDDREHLINLAKAGDDIVAKYGGKAEQVAATVTAPDAKKK
jgi:hypothetical protein